LDSLFEHFFQKAPSEKNHLRIILEEIGPAPSQVPRNENKTVELPLFGRWETPVQGS